MHFKFLIFRNWKRSADSGENIWWSPYSRKLEGHQVWKDGYVRQPGNRNFPSSTYTALSHLVLVNEFCFAIDHVQ